MEREPLLGPKRRRRSVSETDRHVGRSIERFGTGRRRTIVAAERILEPTAALRKMALLVPEPRQGSGQPQGKFARACGPEPVESASQIVVLALKPVEPLARIRAQVRLRLLRERQEVLSVALPQPVGFSRGLEPLGCVLTDRLQHPEPLLRVAEEVLVNQRLDVEIGVGNLLCRRERPSAREDRETGEQATLLLIEQ